MSCHVMSCHVMSCHVMSCLEHWKAKELKLGHLYFPSLLSYVHIKKSSFRPQAKTVIIWAFIALLGVGTLNVCLLLCVPQGRDVFANYTGTVLQKFQ
jgi:hypothetical protein